MNFQSPLFIVFFTGLLGASSLSREAAKASLLEACSHGDMEAVTSLFAEHFAHNAFAASKCLTMALQHGQIPVVQFLMDASDLADLTADEKEVVIADAFKSHSVDLVTYLLDHGLGQWAQGHYAAKSNLYLMAEDAAMVRLLAAREVDLAKRIEYTQGHGFQIVQQTGTEKIDDAAHRAAETGNLEILGAILDSGRTGVGVHTFLPFRIPRHAPEAKPEAICMILEREPEKIRAVWEHLIKGCASRVPMGFALVVPFTHLQTLGIVSHPVGAEHLDLVISFLNQAIMFSDTSEYIQLVLRHQAVPQETMETLMKEVCNQIGLNGNSQNRLNIVRAFLEAGASPIVNFEPGFGNPIPGVTYGLFPYCCIRNDNQQLLDIWLGAHPNLNEKAAGGLNSYQYAIRNARLQTLIKLIAAQLPSEPLRTDPWDMGRTPCPAEVQEAADVIAQINELIYAKRNELGALEEWVMSTLETMMALRASLSGAMKMAIRSGVEKKIMAAKRIQAIQGAFVSHD